jgi:hypothetical protein
MSAFSRRRLCEPPPLSPEFQLLLACIRDDPAEVLEERLEATGPDAAELLRLARYHRGTSLLYLCLQKHGLQDALAPEASGHLEGAHLTLAARQTRMISVALEIIQALGQAGIRCLPLKGTALIAAAWPEYMPRDMWDLDLLVSPEDSEPAATALRELGFVTDEESFRHCPWSPHPVKASRGDVGLDLHTAPWGSEAMEPLGPNVEELWARSRPGMLLDQPVPVPSPEDMVFILLAGLARDRFDTTLRSWADLRWLLTAPGWAADPGLLWEAAAALRGERLLGTALRFAAELFGEEISPPSAWDQRDTLAYERARPVLWRRLLSEEGADRVPRAALRLLAGGRGTGAEIEAAGRAWGLEHPGALSRAGRLGTKLALAGGGLVYGGRLLVSRRLRRELREEWRLLRAVRGR